MKKHACPLQYAKEAILLGQYTEAISLLQPLSDNGLCDAQFLHAYLHFWDDGLSRIDAVNLMNAAAKRDHAEANYILAICPDLSPGYIFKLPKTNNQFDYLLRASELGSDFAGADLAECYLLGIQVEPSPKKAREMLAANFEQGRRSRPLSKTSYLLGRMELLGIGGSKDPDSAISKLGYSVYAADGSYATAGIELIRTWVTDFPEKNRGSFLSDIEVLYQQNKLKHAPAWQRFLHHYCLHSLEYDLRGISIDAFMDFVFDHFPRLRHDQSIPEWERQAKVIFEPREVVHLYTEMFQHAALIAERYRIDQIEQGFGMSGIRGWANWTIGCVLSDVSIPIEEAETCIYAMYELFAQLFLKSDFESIGYMWWDIGYGDCGHGWRNNPTVKRRVWTDEAAERFGQATFETMVKVLQMPDIRCQEAAIHGLGHSRHPDKERVLQNYLEEHPDLPLILREYTLSALRGEIM